MVAAIDIVIALVRLIQTVVKPVQVATQGIVGVVS